MNITMNSTKAEMFDTIEKLQNENLELTAKLADPNAGQIAQFREQAAEIQSEIEQIRKTDPNSNEVHNLASRKSRINGYIKVLGGEAVTVGQRGSTRREFTTDEIQERLSALIYEREEINNQEVETLEGLKRKTSITSELSKWRKKLRDEGITPINPLEDKSLVDSVEDNLGQGDDLDGDDLGDDLDDDDDDEEWDDDDDDDDGDLSSMNR